MGKESLIKSSTKKESTAKLEDVREQDAKGAANPKKPAQSKAKTQI